MLKFVLGKSKTGKTTYIYEEIKENIEVGKSVILFVPSQCRAKAENEYIKSLNTCGIMGVNITTISEYIKEELKIRNLHLDEKYMSKLDRKVIITKVIKENKELFNVFKKVKNYPGFLNELDIYMDIFRKNDSDINYFDSKEFSNKRMNLKFHELLNVYKKYVEKMKEEYIDSVDEVELYIKYLSENKEAFSNTCIFFDGYNNFTSNEYKFINELMKKKLDITITLNTDISKIEDIYSNNTNAIFEIPNTTYKKICKMASKNDIEVENIVKYENVLNSQSDLKYIANNIFEENKEKIKAENINILMLSNIRDEIEYIADVIAKKVQNGYRYKDFAIYSTNPKEYERIATRVFYEKNINCYISNNKNISESILVKYIEIILNMSVTGLNLEQVFNILKLGLTDVDLRDVYILENYMKEFNLNKYLVDKKLALNNSKASYDLDKLNEIKNKVIKMYSFVIALNNVTAKEYVEAIYNHLNEQNILNNYGKIQDSIVNDEKSVGKITFESQIWEKLSSIFDSIVKIYKDEKLTSEEFRNIFNILVQDTNIKTVPPLKDAVEFVDINSSKLETKKEIFFVGVIEGEFPKKEEEDIFFNDNELDELKSENIELRENSTTRLNMGLFNIYEALNNVTDKLIVTIPSASISGKATRMSSIITLFEQIALVEIKGNVTGETSLKKLEDFYSKNELFLYMVQNIKEKNKEISYDEFMTLYKYYLSDEKYKNILKYKKDDSNLSKEITDKIYKNGFKTSVSKLELFKKCPFSYYMQYVLKVTPNKEARLNVLELGSFLHGVLEEFSKTLFIKNIRWQEILNEDLEDIKDEYFKILEKVIEEQIEYNLSKQKQSVRYVILKRKLVKTMRKVIRVIALSYNQSEFEPYGYELEFNDNSKLLPMEIEIGNGKFMKVIGKIDRVDMLKLNEKRYVRIVDYKSNGKDLKIDNIKEGLSLQLISYFMAFFENNKENVKPAAIVYFNLSDKLVSLAQYEDNNEIIKKELMKKLKMNGIFLNDIEILNKMDRKFEKDPSMSFIDITPRALKPNSSKALLDDEFTNLCKTAKGVLQDMGKSIANGEVRIKPNKKADYCKYCNYSSVCRRNIEV